MTFAEKFQSLKVAFDKADTKKFDAFFAIQLTMTDEDCGGTFYIEYKDNNYSVEPYDYYDNTASVIATASAIAKLSKGTIAKDLVVYGNAADVKVLASSLKVASSSAKKKTVAKKTTTPVVKKATTPVVKKTTVKKDTKAAK